MKNIIKTIAIAIAISFGSPQAKAQPVNIVGYSGTAFPIDPNGGYDFCWPSPSLFETHWIYKPAAVPWGTVMGWFGTFSLGGATEFSIWHSDVGRVDFFTVRFTPENRGPCYGDKTPIFAQAWWPEAQRWYVSAEDIVFRRWDTSEWGLFRVRYNGQQNIRVQLVATGWGSPPTSNAYVENFL